MHENPFENVIFQMASILSGGEELKWPTVKSLI